MVAELRQKVLAEMAAQEAVEAVVVALETGLVGLATHRQHLHRKVVMVALEKMSIGIREAVVAVQLR